MIYFSRRQRLRSVPRDLLGGDVDVGTTTSVDVVAAVASRRSTGIEWRRICCHPRIDCLSQQPSTAVVAAVVTAFVTAVLTAVVTAADVADFVVDLAFPDVCVDFVLVVAVPDTAVFGM